MPFHKRTKRWLVYLLARVLIFVWNLQPLFFALGLGKWMGFCAFYLVRGPRIRAQRQMMAALGYSVEEAHREVKTLFQHCGMLAVELAMLPRLQTQLAEYVHLSDEDEAMLADALDQGKGAVLVSAHLGNWELLAQRMVAAGFPSSTLARLNPNPYLGRWIVAQRSRFGLNVIDRSDVNAARKILAALKKNHLVGFLIDQDTRVASVDVPFFGRLASTPTGAAQFALRRQIPVFAVFSYREQGHHRIIVERISAEGISGSDDFERTRALTAVMTRHIESAIRARPSQWMWFHERWKTQALL